MKLWDNTRCCPFFDILSSHLDEQTHLKNKNTLKKCKWQYFNKKNSLEYVWWSTEAVIRDVYSAQQLFIFAEKVCASSFWGHLCWCGTHDPGTSFHTAPPFWARCCPILHSSNIVFSAVLTGVWLTKTLFRDWIIIIGNISGLLLKIQPKVFFKIVAV